MSGFLPVTGNVRAEVLLHPLHCNGKDNFSFRNKELGSSSCTGKKKSPSQIRREQRRKTERSLKKAAEPIEKVVEASESEESGTNCTTIVKCADFQCSQCDLSFKAEEDLNAHIGEVHSAPVLPTPEKERAPDQAAELLLTPISGQRKEEDTHLHDVSGCDLPMKPRGSAKCGKTFPNENDLRMHAKKYHEQGQPSCWMCA